MSLIVRIGAGRRQWKHNRYQVLGCKPVTRIVVWLNSLNVLIFSLYKNRYKECQK